MHCCMENYYKTQHYYVELHCGKPHILNTDLFSFNNLYFIKAHSLLHIKENIT